MKNAFRISALTLKLFKVFYKVGHPVVMKIIIAAVGHTQLSFMYLRFSCNTFWFIYVKKSSGWKSTEENLHPCIWLRSKFQKDNKVYKPENMKSEIIIHPHVFMRKYSSKLIDVLLVILLFIPPEKGCYFVKFYRDSLHYKAY